MFTPSSDSILRIVERAEAFWAEVVAGEGLSMGRAGSLREADGSVGEAEVEIVVLDGVVPESVV